MWLSAGKIRYRKIWLENNVIKAKDPYEPLYPFDKPNLPNEFAKVTDLKSALRFERKFAPLNYDSLLVNTKSELEFIRKYAPLNYDFTSANPEERKGGDPVEWVIEQARFVRLAIELVHDLAIKDGRRALRRFRQFVVYKDYSGPALQGQGELTYPRGAIMDTTIVPAPKSESDALWYAPSIITLLVNANTRTLRQELILNSKGKIFSIQLYHTLIEAIWSMAGNLATRAQQDPENGYFRRCAWCNTPFLATDKRRKYCPPIFGKESLCGNKFRQHKFQAKKGR